MQGHFLQVGLELVMIFKHLMNSSHQEILGQQMGIQDIVAIFGPMFYQADILPI